MFLESYDLLYEYIVLSHGLKNTDYNETQVWKVATSLEWPADRDEISMIVLCSFKYVRYSEFQLCKEGLLPIE